MFLFSTFFYLPLTLPSRCTSHQWHPEGPSEIPLPPDGGPFSDPVAHGHSGSAPARPICLASRPEGHGGPRLVPVPGLPPDAPALADQENQRSQLHLPGVRKLRGVQQPDAQRVHGVPQVPALSRAMPSEGAQGLAFLLTTRLDFQATQVTKERQN